MSVLFNHFVMPDFIRHPWTPDQVWGDDRGWSL